MFIKKNTNQVSRSFLIREDFLNGLYELKENYSVSINSLVNIAIRNAVTEEKNGNKRIRQIEIVKKYHGIIIYKIISWLDFIIKKLLV